MHTWQDTLKASAEIHWRDITCPVTANAALILGNDAPTHLTMKIRGIITSSIIYVFLNKLVIQGREPNQQ